MENILTNLDSNKSYETHNPVQNLSALKQPFENTEKVQNNNNGFSPQRANLNAQWPPKI